MSYNLHMKQAGRGVMAIALVVCGLLMPMRSLAAADASADMSLDREQVSPGESAVLSLTLHNCDDAQPPEIQAAGLRIEPRGTSSQFSMINGRTERAVTHQYLVVGTRPGRYNIGPFRIVDGNRELTIEPVTLEISNDATAADGEKAPALRAKLQIRPEALVVGQDFVMELSIYSRGASLHPSVDLNGMPEQGLRMTQWVELPTVRERVDGQMCDVRRFRTQARALAAGKIELQPTVRVRVREEERSRDNDPLSMMGGSIFVGTPFDRASYREREILADPLVLDIQNLPETGRPASFNGAIGSGFGFQARVSPQTVEAGAPLTLSMELTGPGNSLEGIPAPAGDFGKSFRAYDARPSGGAGEKNGGHRSYEQVLIPRDPTVTSVPAIEFCYYDPAKHSYEVLKAGPFPIQVTPSTHPDTAALAPAAVAPAATAQELVQGSDILYLKESSGRPNRWQQWDRGIHRTGAWWWYLPPALAGLIALLKAWRELRSMDVSGDRRRKASRAAAEALRRARAAAAAKNRAAFYDALASAFSDYVGERLALPPGEVTGDRLLAALRRAKLKPQDEQKLQALLAECEAARFGGAAADVGALGTAAWDARIRDAQACLSRIEKLDWSATGEEQP